MNINEFKQKLILLNRFTKKLNAGEFPGNVKTIMLKLYASSLKIRLTDKMACDFIEADRY